MATLPLNLRECTVKITQEDYSEFPNRLSYLDVVARHPKHGQLAKMRCIVAGNRPLFRTQGDFWEMMDEESDELMQFSKKLFDAYGNVQPWLTDGGYKSGSGCWGKELNDGQIVHFSDDLEVEEQFRGRGVGSFVLQELFKSPLIKQNANIFCWPLPVPTRRNESDTVWRTKVDRVNRFFRKNGFRRIGRTPFFGYSLDPTHPSRQLPIENDPGLLGDEFPDMSSLTLEETTRKYPLHIAIDDRLQKYKIADIITAAYAQDPAKIHEPDLLGYTPVHIAVIVQNLPALNTLLDLGVEDDLRNTSNKEHLTPLEILQDGMLQTRQANEDALGKWDGYSKEMLLCEYLLKKALGLPLIAQSENEYVVKARLGCTCGSCQDQWLSPIMSARLHIATAVACEVMPMELDKFKSSGPLSADQAALINTQFLPPWFSLKMYKSFYEGYCSVFDAIERVLQDKVNGIPTPACVLAKAASQGYDVDYYIKNGGLVEYALDAIITQAQNQMVGYQDEGHYGNAGKCANDAAFNLVRHKLGLVPIIYA